MSDNTNDVYLDVIADEQNLLEIVATSGNIIEIVNTEKILQSDLPDIIVPSISGIDGGTP